jgi:hypothetical protein
MMERMSEIIRSTDSTPAAHDTLKRSIGVDVAAKSGASLPRRQQRLRRRDAKDGILERRSHLTSIPFGTQYEYTPSYNDFGHTDDDEHFFRQMDFLSPELLRVLKPGRIMAAVST